MLSGIIYPVMEDAILKSIRHLEKPVGPARNSVEKLKGAIHSHLETTSTRQDFERIGHVAN